MPNPPSDPDWHQWRGSMATKMDTVIEEVRKLGTKFEAHEEYDDERFEAQAKKNSATDSKFAWWSGAAAAIGSIAGWAISIVTGK